MNHPPKRLKRHGRTRSSALLRPGDLIKVGGMILVAMTLNLGAQYLHDRQIRLRAIDDCLSKWRTIYRLTDEQTRRIRDLECGFHGTSRFDQVRRSEGEHLQHIQQIAEVMDTDAGQQFLQSQETSP